MDGLGCLEVLSSYCWRGSFTFHHLSEEIRWKEELKEECGTEVCKYKQVGTKDQVIGSSW